jgi:hypothetical protein
VLTVIDGAVASSETLGLDPELVIIGPDPAFPRPAEVRRPAIGAALELIEDAVDEDHPVHDRLNNLACVAGNRLIGRDGSLCARSARDTGESADRRKEGAERGHPT